MPAAIGTTAAANDSRHRLSSANLNAGPSAFSRCDSFASSSPTRKRRNANDTSSEELLKKNSV